MVQKDGKEKNVSITARPAATIILVRQAGGELQVYLLKRGAASGFMAGFYVFPGGRVDPEDREAFWRQHLDSDPETLKERFGDRLSMEALTAFCVAAIRETFEEAGVLLACHRQPGDALKLVCDRRLAGVMGLGWLRQLVIDGEWSLLTSALFPWSHWITPAEMKYRFDTRFFLACLPPQQVCRADGRETTQGVWIAPADALAANLTGKIPLSPPTVVTLHQLLSCRHVDDLLQQTAGAGWGEALLPRLVSLEKGAVILEPWDPLRYEKDVRLDPEVLKDAVLPAGAPFSRIFFYEGLWRPVSSA